MGGFRDAVRTTVHVERSRIVWKMPLRSSIVVVLVIAVPLSLGDTTALFPLALGALFASLADVGEAVGHRWRTMLWTTTWLMAATTIGILVSGYDGWLVATTALVAAVCGFTGAAGPRAALGGVLTLVIFTIYAGSPQLGSSIVREALLIGLGGLIQTAVTVIPPLLRDPGLINRPDPVEPLHRRLIGHLRWDDLFARHSVRLAIGVTAATILCITGDYPHEYWIPMTVAWVARPDRTGTVGRVEGRTLGTVAGVLVMGLVVDVLKLPVPGLVLMVGLSAFIALAFIWANYSIAVIGITMMVLSLFDLLGEVVGGTLVLRIVDTVVAGVIALLASLLWPGRTQP